MKGMVLRPTLFLLIFLLGNPLAAIADASSETAAAN